MMPEKIARGPHGLSVIEPMNSVRVGYHRPVKPFSIGPRRSHAGRHLIEICDASAMEVANAYHDPGKGTREEAEQFLLDLVNLYF